MFEDTESSVLGIFRVEKNGANLNQSCPILDRIIALVLRNRKFWRLGDAVKKMTYTSFLSFDDQMIVLESHRYDTSVAFWR